MYLSTYLTIFSLSIATRGRKKAPKQNETITPSIKSNIIIYVQLNIDNQSMQTKQILEQCGFVKYNKEREKDADHLRKIHIHSNQQLRIRRLAQSNQVDIITEWRFQSRFTANEVIIQIAIMTEVNRLPKHKVIQVLFEECSILIYMLLQHGASSYGNSIHIAIHTKAIYS